MIFYLKKKSFFFEKSQATITNISFSKRKVSFFVKRQALAIASASTKHTIKTLALSRC